MRIAAKCACLLRSKTRTFLILTLMAFAAPVWCQIDTGTILGTVSDPSGAVVPGAKVSLTNEGTNLTVTMTTGGDGGYTFSPVKIGTYTVTVEAAGF
ncbi:MAG TPA: carboxypeptidase-like regulatory domain-containing protein, partial [Terriglobia bacterium]|nr:carboxypeptidase-like regulatory domain-containing protein [Terriglobia bacterium]